MQMTTVQIKKPNLTWVYGFAGSRRQVKMTSTDLRRTINAPTWTDFHLFLQKKLTTNVYKTEVTQFNWMVHLINKMRDKEALACMCARVQKRRENEVTRAPNNQSQ